MGPMLGQFTASPIPALNVNSELNVNSITSLPSATWKRWLDSLSDQQMQSLEQEWLFWSRPEQRAPPGNWHSWLFLGGRGAGKTRAGAEWIKATLQPNERIALIGPTLHDVREVMIDGPSGLRAIADADNRPYYEVSRRRLRWPKGGVAYAFSAEDPESLRGPQFHRAWADEFCAWTYASETLAHVRMGLRLGQAPKLCITTTPKPIKALKLLLKEKGCVIARSTTADNIGNLSEGFLESLNSLYGGTRLAAQELMGQVVEAHDNALWNAADLEKTYAPRPTRFDEILMAIDPSVTGTGDTCGIIIAARIEETAFVLDDKSVHGLTPNAWAAKVAHWVKDFCVQTVVAEANQGGEMVRTLLALADCNVPIRLVHARVSKRARAEPVAALYEQGRVKHCPFKWGARFSALDEELMSLGDFAKGNKSPDRADALVWAITELLLKHRQEPRLTRL